MRTVLFFMILHSFGYYAQSYSHEKFKKVNKIEFRDSLFILYTVKEWGKNDWYTFRDYSQYYKISNEQVEYSIIELFYSPDNKKLLVWVCEKTPNAESIEQTSQDVKLDRMCPNGSDTIFNLISLIGIRDTLNEIWKLFPFETKSASCYPKKEDAIAVLYEYFFYQMKTDQMYRIAQIGIKKGHKVLQSFGYNIQDKEFWDKCWLFIKDNVGSYGLYPFQLKGYDCFGTKCNKNSGDPFDPPLIEYPENILNLYNLH